MKNIYKKSCYFLLALILFAGSFLAAIKPSTVLAATQLRTLFASESITALTNIETSNVFTVGYNGNVFYQVGMETPADFHMSLTNSSGEEIDKEYASADSSNWMQGDDGAYYYVRTSALNVTTGKYRIRLTFNENTTYSLVVLQDSYVPSISNTSTDLTVGFTKTLKVSNAGAYSVKWTSSNKKIATVNSKGVITGKKKGSCKITAKINGENLTCTVKVYNNIYSDKKLTNSSFTSGKCSIYVYQVSFDASGNIRLKVRVINNDLSDVTKLVDVKFNIKTSSNVTVSSYTLGDKNFSIKSGSYKDFAVTIPKSKIKQTKTGIDLRNLYGIEIEGSYYTKY